MTQLATAPAAAPSFPANGLLVDPVTRVAGGINLNVNSDGSRHTAARVGVSNYRGYEQILLGRDWRDAIFVSSRSCGYHGGQHSVAAAQALEMATGLTPPPIAVGIRNMGLCAEMIHAEAAHLVLLVAPDFCEESIRMHWPDLWPVAVKTPAPQVETHGYKTIGEIMSSFNPIHGVFYKSAFHIARIPYQMYALIGGKYPHPETIVPGGVAASVSHTTVSKFHDYVVRLLSLVDPAKGVVCMVDDLLNFLVEQVPALAEIGVRPANMIDSGMWDSPEGYDASWEGLTDRGNRRWSSPGVIMDGKLVTTDLRAIAEGITESVDHSYYDSPGSSAPFDRQTLPRRAARSFGGRYSWSNSVRWNGSVVETGSGAGLWATALRGQMPYNPFISCQNGGVQLNLPEGALPQLILDWKPPAVWNAIERNRARLYNIVFAALVAANEALNALDLQKQDDVAASAPEMRHLKPRGNTRGVGFTGDGLLGHWLELNDGTISNYQIVTPAAINAGPGGPAEEAINGTPILQDVTPGLEAQIALRSFDPCGNCAAT